MTVHDDTAAAHLETQENIPWLVIGRLDAARAARANQHLKLCAECRAEHAMQQALQAAMVAAPPEPALPPDFAALDGKIDDFERQRPADRSTSSAGRTGRAVLGILAAPRFLARAALLLVVAGAGLFVDRWTAPRYATATNSIVASTGIGPAVRLVVMPGIPVAEFESLLRSVDAKVIDGPNPEHAWTIELSIRTRGPALTQTLDTLQHDPRVRLAEPMPGWPPR